MRLERLSIHGFKSFGDRVTLEFAPGISAVVGPNGSGKSNVLDALRWATGGGRAQSFRAGEKTDLIFHGAAGKRRLGRAEVEVELTTRDGRHKIRRSLDRDGETKLTLNGRGARFLDVDEALAGSGLGRGSLAIIGQGEVSGVLMADPARLLSYVAEAAGVARLSERRERTEARLETARGHLEALEAKLAEDDERLEALRAEADAARRHDALRAEVQRLRYTVAVARVASIRGELEGIDAQVARLEADLADGRADLEDLRGRVAEARRADAAAEAAHREATAEHARAAAEVRIAEHALDAATTRTADLERDRERTETERANLLAQAPPDAPDDDLAALRAADEAARTAWEAAQATRAAAEADADAAREAREAAEADAARRARAVADADARREAWERQRDALAARLEEVRGPADDGADAADPAAAEADAEAELEAAEAELADVRSTLEAAQGRLADAAAEARARTRDAERQRAAFAARRGYAEGPRQALTSGIDGVLGSVADLLRVEPGYEEAIQLALARRAEFVVVENEAVAREVLAHVREAGGWVTLLPLDLVRGREAPVDADLLAADGVLGRATDVVRVDARFQVIADDLLSGTVLVETTERATALARGAASRPRLVTLEGAVLDPGGALSGGKRQGRTAVVGAAAEVEAAEADADTASAAEAEARTAVEAAQAAFEAAAGRAMRARDAARTARKAAAAWREEAAAQARLREDVERQWAAHLAAEADLPTAPAPADAAVDLEGVRRADEAARAALRAAREAEAPAFEASTQAAEARARAEERARAYEAAKARYDEDLARAEALANDVARLADAIDAGWASVRDAEARAQAARAAMPDVLPAAEAAREEAREALREAEAAAEAAQRARGETSEALEAARVQRARREQALEAAEEEVAAFPDGLEAVDVGDRAARSRLRDAEAELEAIGAVNHLAARNLDALEEEHQGRRADVNEAREAVEALSDTLHRLDRETTARLSDAIAGVRTRFEAHVNELFGPEGEGAIETEHEEGRPTGLRIRLQPPGKQTQALGLLSVGERTMGALAFLFSLMGEEHGTTGLPIAVLDEVDAPLDEANIRRYRAFLERLAGQGTQFVLITHQKATFEVADVMWGVTTERGVSRVFSIHKGDDEPRSHQDALLDAEPANA